jgi:hypothetical protein
LSLTLLYSLASGLSLALAALDTVLRSFVAVQDAPSPPIIVKLIEPYRDPTGLADVLVGALGLSGVLALIAVVCGLLMGGVLFLARSRRPLQ